MKQTLLQRTNALIALGMSAGILLSSSSNAATHGVSEEEPPAKNAKSKTSYSRNNASVKIYPDVVKRSMHVIAKNNKATIDFFVFDLQGTLIQSFKMKERDHQKITGLARGKYIYRVFAGDTETANGEFEIR